MGITKMVKYSCEKCGKDFSQKTHYDSHNIHKTPCENKADKINAHVDKAVQEKLKELNKNLIVKNEKVNVNKEIKMNAHKIQKPFLKWVGGKTQIIDDIISKLPNEINNYHELF